MLSFKLVKVPVASNLPSPNKSIAKLVEAWRRSTQSAFEILVTKHTPTSMVWEVIDVKTVYAVSYI